MMPLMRDSSNTVQLPGDAGTLFAPNGDAREIQRIVDTRHAFGVQYCKAKGWSTNPAELSFEQIFEIRAQPGWKNAGS
jgi:hypothetical protein